MAVPDWLYQSEIPEHHGPPTTCRNRVVRWRKAGVWDRLFGAVSEAYDGDVVMINPTSTRPREMADGDDGGMGRSRSGLTSKIHALVDAEGRPVILRLTGGQIANCTQADAFTENLGEGNILLVDKGYDSNAPSGPRPPSEGPGC